MRVRVCVFGCSVVSSICVNYVGVCACVNASVHKCEKSVRVAEEYHPLSIDIVLRVGGGNGRC